MNVKLDIRSSLLGLLIGVAFILVLGAASGPKEEVYQLSMAANEDYVFFGRMHTASGKVEMWKYRSYANQAVPVNEDKKYGNFEARVVE